MDSGMYFLSLDQTCEKVMRLSFVTSVNETGSTARVVTVHRDAPIAANAHRKGTAGVLTRVTRSLRGLDVHDLRCDVLFGLGYRGLALCCGVVEACELRQCFLLLGSVPERSECLRQLVVRHLTCRIARNDRFQMRKSVAGLAERNQRSCQPNLRVVERRIMRERLFEERASGFELSRLSMHFGKLVCRIRIAWIDRQFVFERFSCFGRIIACAAVARLFEQGAADAKADARPTGRQRDHLSVFA